jgi:hypothetical protein
MCYARAGSSWKNILVDNKCCKRLNKTTVKICKWPYNVCMCGEQARFELIEFPERRMGEEMERERGQMALSC